MKLRNKKTGEIGKIILKHLPEDNQLEVITDNKLYVVKTLAELNEEWEDVSEEEDYEEPKQYWYIAYNGAVGCFEHDNNWQYMDFNWQDKLKQIGNYFETREEAEKAVERLRAWKRLKEARFAFGLPEYRLNEASSIIGATGSVGFSCLCYEDFDKDLDLLFGGEE